MSDTSPILSLPYIQPSQAQKHVTHNEALRLLDVVVQLVVEDRDRTQPPGSPTEGQRHIVAAGGTGDWAGQDGAVAVFENTGWIFIVPSAGWAAQDLAGGQRVVFDGTSWNASAAQSDNLSGIGVNTTSDTTNRLAVSAPATLLNHEGTGHQLKINKAQSGDTASLLFQTGFSGRAEMGTAGSDAWSLKVSANGTAWTQALAVNAANGRVSGAAVQASATDTTPGRLMRADYGYGRGNVVGPVGQAGGVPTGALLQRGSNANGSFVRFADGTQICWAAITLTQNRNFSLRGEWNFPAIFASTPSVVHVPDLGTATLYATSINDRIYFGVTGILAPSSAPNTSVFLDQYIISGAPSIPSGATMLSNTTAFGRWF